MPDPKQLPHLVKLLDDDSDIVRDTVLQQLESFGPTLRRELARQRVTLSSDQENLMSGLLDEHRRERLKNAWPQWKIFENDKQRLEAGLSLLAEFLSNFFVQKSLTALLDQLTMEFGQSHRKRDPLTLSRFLFHEKKLEGASQSEYYDPQNSNLLYVIQEKQGIPISLACIFILIGYRLGLNIEGCNLPGHFLATAEHNGAKVLVDCFHGGRFIDDKDLAGLNIAVPVTMADLIKLECNADTIVARMLRNLAHSYKQLNETANMQLMTDLLKTFPEEDGETE